MIKKMSAIFLLIILVAVLAGCGTDDSPADVSQPEQSEAAANGSDDSFTIIFEGVNITPGNEFNQDAIDGEPEVSLIPSSAFPNDPVHIYNYSELIEIHAVMLDGVETIYFVHILDESIATAEGVSISDDVSRVLEVYGEEYEDGGIRKIYTRGDVELSFIIRDDVVVSIEYWLAGLVE